MSHALHTLTCAFIFFLLMNLSHAKLIRQGCLSIVLEITHLLLCWHQFQSQNKKLIISFSRVAVSNSTRWGGGHDFPICSIQSLSSSVRVIAIGEDVDPGNQASAGRPESSRPESVIPGNTAWGFCVALCARTLGRCAEGECSKFYIFTDHLSQDAHPQTSPQTSNKKQIFVVCLM